MSEHYLQQDVKAGPASGISKLSGCLGTPDHQGAPNHVWRFSGYESEQT